MSVKSSSSVGETSGEVIKSGYLKKLKTMRKKYFVLRAETLESSARLEYYDSEKKYRNQQQPKRSISLKACFNINKRVDTKHKHVIALYTKDDCFCIVLDNDRDLEDWLKALLSLQHGEDVVDGEPIKPTFEHVWQVTMLNKGLGSSRNILGAYHLCFTDKQLSLVRKSTGLTTGNISTDHVEFSLMSVRRCGHSECFFYMEVGRSAVTGAGELWMQTEDTNIAQNMGEVILRAMSNNNKEDLGPKPRIRSSSANEASKPILVQRRQTHSGQKNTTYCSPSQDGDAAAPEPVPEAPATSGPTSGYANICTSSVQVAPQTQSVSVGGIVFYQPHLYQRPSQRRHSVSAGAAAPWSGMAHHQRTQSLPLAGATAATTPGVENNNHVIVPASRPHKRPNNNTPQNRLGGRERCDSMPSRCRTSSEGTAPGCTPPVAVIHPLRHPHHLHLAPYHRPQSMYAREVSHSPPGAMMGPTGLAGSPVSPASAACSTTDSAGSSLSIDEGTDGWTEYVETSLGRYGLTAEETSIGRYGISLTPDEPIAEENPDEGTDNCYVAVSPTSGSPPLNGGYVPMAPLSSDDGYVDMSPRGRHDMSPAASTCSITSGTPSTDLRFSEYHLEKVSSYFTPSEEDDTSSAERPMRAYSVGSRPDILKLRGTKHDTGQNLHGHDNRVRAFSVGSRSKGIHSRVLPPHGHHGGAHPAGGGKSSSAPLLSGSNSHLGSQNSMERMEDLMELDFSRNLPQNPKGSTPIASHPPGSSDTGYVDMSSPRTRTISGGIPSVPAGYVEMRPGMSECSVGSPDMPYMDMKPSISPVRPSSMDTAQEDHPYLDMRPNLATSPLKPSTLGSIGSFPPSTSGNQTNPYLEMKPSSSNSTKFNPYYVEMSGPSSKYSSSPKNNQIPQNIPKTTSPIQEEYLEMDFKQSKQQQNRTLSGAARTQPVDLPKNKTSEGYMDMTWNHRHQRKSSLDSAKINVNNNQDDYMNMSSGSARKKERKGSKKDKTRSQPITIQQPTTSTTTTTITSTKSSQSPVSSFASFLQNRKNSSGTPPKNHPPNFLPLQSCSYSPSSSPFSSLRRPRSRKNSRRDSKDSSSGLVTPTNSDNSTIFPFSPGSPIKPFNVKTPEGTNVRKCPVDASSGTVKISASVSGKPPTGGGDYQKMSFDFSNKIAADKSSDYTEMTPSNSSNPDLDYVNYCPAAPKQRTTSNNSDEYGEYAIMRPVQIVHSYNHPIRKISAPLVSSNTNLTKQLSSLSMNNIMKPCVFRPIVEPREDNRLGAISPKIGDIAPHRSFENLQGDDKIASQTENADGNYETLRTGTSMSPISKIARPQSVAGSEKVERVEKIAKNHLGSVGSLSSLPGSLPSSEKPSRPSSVSSDATKGSLSRPSSVSSELGSTSSTIVGDSRPGSVCSDQIKADKVELHYASLDLAPVDDDTTTKSPRSARMQETRSPTPSSGPSEPGFTYAEIDFIKSESLKNKKVSH